MSEFQNLTIVTSTEIIGGSAQPTTTIFDLADWLGQRVEWHDGLGTIIGVTSTFTVAIRMDDGSAILSRLGDFSFISREP